MTTVDPHVRAEEEAAWAQYDEELRGSEGGTAEDLWPPRKQTKQRLSAAGLQEAA